MQSSNKKREIISISGRQATIKYDDGTEVDLLAKCVTDRRVLLMNEFKRFMKVPYIPYILCKKRTRSYMLMNLEDYTSIKDIGLDWLLTTFPDMKQKILCQCYVLWIFYGWNICESKMFINQELNEVVTFGEDFVHVERILTIPSDRENSLFKRLDIRGHYGQCLRYMPGFSSLSNQEAMAKTMEMKSFINLSVLEKYTELSTIANKINSRIQESLSYSDYT